MPRAWSLHAAPLQKLALSVSGFDAVDGVQSAASKCAAELTWHLDQRMFRYSITLSAAASSVGGTVRPKALAALRLITNSKLVGCWIGKSAGLVPLRTFPT